MSGNGNSTVKQVDMVPLLGDLESSEGYWWGFKYNVVSAKIGEGGHFHLFQDMGWMIKGSFLREDFLSSQIGNFKFAVICTY